MDEIKLKAPFPAFGGKSKAAHLVWDRLGDVDNYIEPFAFSAACLLARPAEHVPRVESLGDSNDFVVNFWRATKYAPDEVAEHADNPVNETDLFARHKWLMLSPEAARFRAAMRDDPEYFDAKIAGWWCWGACCWIGSGWCEDPKNAMSQKMPRAHRGNDGKPWNLPGILYGDIAPRRPQLADAYSRGRGVNGNDGALTCAERRAFLTDWFNRLRDRLRPVRVCCGDWIRVCDSYSVTTRLGLTGVFLDPPYAHDLGRFHGWVRHLQGEGPPPGDATGKASRNKNLYANDRTQDVDRLVADVHMYCRERGTDPLMRLALAGYAGEHEALEGIGWSVVEWKGRGGYANQGENRGLNDARERIWFSPHCLRPGNGISQMEMF